ncbi:MAG: N-acetylmuramoyl-L-alanine amidase [Pseudomonadota bacterium]
MLGFVSNCCRYRVLAALLVLAACGGVSATELVDFRVWTSPDKTRAVLDLTGTVDYRLFTLDSPDRVVLDLSDAKAVSGFAPPPADGDFVRRVRTGRRDNGSLRVVLDLQAGAKVQSFLLPPAAQYGHRLVVDLFPAGKAAAPAAPVKPVKQMDRRANRDIIVAIDAGHGGEDPGAIGLNGTYEKDVVLAISKALKKELDAQPGFSGMLVRTGDYYIPHLERPAKARAARADLFISIHADAFKNRKVKGTGVFVLSRRRASSEAAKFLANRANQSDLVGGVNLGDKDETLAAVLLDLSQGASMGVSKSIGDRILDALGGIGPVHKDYVESAPFAVLTAPDIPSVLVETGYISNPEEERRLRTAHWQRKIAAAIAAGIENYFYGNPPPDTWLANNPAERSHIVASGETLSGIAERHRVSLRRLRSANSINGDMLKVGTVLVIPAG